MVDEVISIQDIKPFLVFNKWHPIMHKVVQHNQRDAETSQSQILFLGDNVISGR